MSIESHSTFRHPKQSYRALLRAFIMENLVCDVEIRGVFCKMRKIEEGLNFLPRTTTAEKLTATAVPQAIAAASMLKDTNYCSSNYPLQWQHIVKFLFLNLEKR